MAEQEVLPGLLIWPGETEVWLGDPEAIVDGGGWIKMDRNLAKTVVGELTTWLDKPATDLPLTAVSGEDYREEFYRANNAEDVMPSWDSLPEESKDCWNRMAIAEKTLVGVDE